MLIAGAGANDLDCFENSALHLAASVGEIEIGPILLKHGIDPNGRNLSWETPVMLAAKNRQDVLVKFLIRNGANPAWRDYQGYSDGGTEEIGGSDEGDNTMPNDSVLFENTRLGEMVSA